MLAHTSLHLLGLRSLGLGGACPLQPRAPASNSSFGPHPCSSPNSNVPCPQACCACLMAPRAARAAGHPPSPCTTRSCARRRTWRACWWTPGSSTARARCRRARSRSSRSPCSTTTRATCPSTTRTTTTTSAKLSTPPQLLSALLLTLRSPSTPHLIVNRRCRAQHRDAMRAFQRSITPP